MDYLFLLARVLYGGFFFLSGVNHFIHLDSSAKYAAMKGVPSPKLGVFVSGLLLVVGGLGIVLGLWVPLAVACLVVFLVPVTLIMHAFWKQTDPMMKMADNIHFMKNVALLGAALAFLFIGHPWPLGMS
jgi:uncharacterized membrane protein YphA (DoxX/SURF4 family)